MSAEPKPKTTRTMLGDLMGVPLPEPNPIDSPDKCRHGVSLDEFCVDCSVQAGRDLDE